MTHTATESALYTRSEVAMLLKLSPSGVLKYTHNGTIPAIKIGKRFRYRRADIDKLLTTNFQPAN
jgi:excisionase family DNA binding protein